MVENGRRSIGWDGGETSYLCRMSIESLKVTHSSTTKIQEQLASITFNSFIS